MSIPNLTAKNSTTNLINVNHNFPKYFIQTQSWSNFWQEANGNGHQVHTIEVDGQLEPILIYEYPWELGQNFWYLPRLFLPPHLNKTEAQNYLQSVLEKIIIAVTTSKPIFLKIEIDDIMATVLELDSVEKLNNFFQDKLVLKTEKKNKTIQYLQTITLDLQVIQNIIIPSQNDLQNLSIFYENSSIFWKTTNENIRRYTKKSLTQNWIISTEKTEENFAAFYKIYNQTKDRQNFAIQNLDYLKTLFQKDFSRVIILYDENKNPQAVWFGIISEKTLTYLYGGNTQVSFEKQGQYLLHLVAVKMAVSEGLIFYDLGGYNPALGFGKFKENYKGIVRTFVGPIDIIFEYPKYKFINFLIAIIKVFLEKK